MRVRAPSSRRSWKRDAAADRLGELQEQIQQRLEQAGGDLGTVAKEFNLQSGEVSPFLRGAGGAPLGTAQPDTGHCVWRLAAATWAHRRTGAGGGGPTSCS